MKRQVASVARVGLDLVTPCPRVSKKILLSMRAKATMAAATASANAQPSTIKEDASAVTVPMGGSMMARKGARPPAQVVVILVSVW